MTALKVRNGNTQMPILLDLVRISEPSSCFLLDLR
jgi:hypothetical protein